MQITPETIRAELMTVADLCRLYGITRRTYDAWIKRDDAPPHFEKDGRRLFLRSQLLAWREPRARRTEARG